MRQFALGCMCSALLFAAMSLLGQSLHEQARHSIQTVQLDPQDHIFVSQRPTPPNSKIFVRAQSWRVSTLVVGSETVVTIKTGPRMPGK